MFIPKNTKFIKFQKNKIKNIPSKGLDLIYGSFGLKAKQNLEVRMGKGKGYVDH